LGYDNQQPSSGDNARNGHSKKKIKNQLGVCEIIVPRDRDASLAPAHIPNPKNMAEGVENILISLYAAYSDQIDPQS
jgi:putative transposase